MIKIRLAAVLLLAFVSVAAAAQTSYDFTTSWYGDEVSEGDTEIRVKASQTVKAYTNVHWSYTFPSIGISESGTMVMEPGSQGGHFNIQYPQNGMYHLPLEGTATISYSDVTKSRSITVVYNEPHLRVDEALVVEGDEEHAVTMRLSRPSTVPISLPVFTNNGSAHDGSDFSLIDQSVTFPARETESMVRFTAAADGLKEGQETFSIRAQSGSYQDRPYVFGIAGTITIDDAEIGTDLAPGSADVFSGDSVDLELTLNRPLHASKNFTVSIGSSDSRVAKARQEAMVIHAGMTSLSIPIDTDAPGDVTITVTFPDETSVGPISAEVHVYGGEFSFDVSEVLVRKKEQLTAGLRLSPPPPSPREVGIELSRSGIVLIHGGAFIGTDGTGAFNFTGLAPGLVDLNIVNGQGAIQATMTARVIDGFSAKSIAPQKGSSSGGTPVTITGTGLGGTCSVLFNGLAATNVKVVNETTLTATTPAHPAGTVDVKVLCDAFIQPLPAAYTFTKPSRGRSVRH